MGVTRERLMKKCLAILITTLFAFAVSAQIQTEQPGIFNFNRVSDQYCTGGQPKLEALEKLKSEGVKVTLIVQVAAGARLVPTRTGLRRRTLGPRSGTWWRWARVPPPARPLDWPPPIAPRPPAVGFPPPQGTLYLAARAIHGDNFREPGPSSPPAPTRRRPRSPLRRPRAPRAAVRAAGRR